MGRGIASRARTGLAALAAALGAAFAAAPAPAQEAAVQSLLIAEPGAADDRALARGHALWLTRELTASGLSASLAPHGSTPDLQAALSLALAGGQAYALVPDLELHAGLATVRLRLYSPAGGELLAAPRASAPLASIGEACMQASRGLISHLGLPDPAASVPPTLDALAASGRALAWIDAGELARAWAEVEGKLSETPAALRAALLDAARRSDTPLGERARVLAAAGDDHGALALVAAELRRQASLERPDRKLLLAGAEVQLARSNPRGARVHIERLLELDADDAEARLALGRALALQNAHAEARAELARAAQLQPWNPQPLALLEELQADAPGERARTLLEAGRREAARFSPHRAERLFTAAAETDPQLAAESSRARARMRADSGRHAEALEAWQQASASQPDDAEAWVGIAEAQRALGAEGADAAFQRALELAPSDPDALTGLGRMHVDFGRAKLAVPLLERAVAAEPAAPAPRRELARALRATGEPARALATLTGADAPALAQAESLREAATLQRELGDLAAARASLERAVALEPWDAAVHSELAGVLAAGGDAARGAEARRLATLLGAEEPAAEASAAGGEALNLDALVLSFSTQLPGAHERRVALLGTREAGGLRTQVLRWLHPRRVSLEPIDAELARSVALRFQHVEPELLDSDPFRAAVDRLYAFEERSSLDAAAIAKVNDLLGTDAVLVTRLQRRPADREDAGNLAPACRDPQRFELEMRMLSGSDADVASILMDVECLAGGEQQLTAWNPRAAALAGALLLLLVFPALRGWGSVVVEIKLPPRTRGFLHIRIAKKPQKATEQRKRVDSGGRLRRSLSSLSRYQKRLAGPRTTFRWIPARKRSYFITVRGPLFDALGDREIGHFLEEQQARVQRGRSVELVYDFNPTECALQVTVLHNREPAKRARVTLRETPNSLRYTRDGVAFYYVGVGTHTIVVGAGDRATERSVRIDAVGNAVPVDIDLGVEDGLLVRDAPAAVEPYLLGDFETAAVALERAGQPRLAQLMRAAHFEQRGDLERAAHEREAAGDVEAAARLRAEGAEASGSAALFEQAGDFASAAAAYRQEGDLEAAARCFEAAYDLDAALECYEASGNVEKRIELHEKTGAYLDAALLCHESGNPDRALQNLQAIERRDPSYGEACRLTADVLAERGDYELAAEKTGEAIALAGGDAAPIELLERHARLLERCEQKERALEAYETVRRRDPRRSDVTQHIEALRSQVRAETVPLRPGGGAQPEAGRYEILGELGRGGMGVVWKARDTRLNRIVALKRLPDNLRDNSAAAALFLREAQAAAQLNHRNIVTLYDAGEENGVYHITMELLEGLPLNAIQTRNGTLSVRDTARLGVQVCAGLQYAHERRVVHRDIKPANLFFTSDKVVKIMDFGLAKTIEEVRKSSTVIGGTPYYMAPEQAAGEAVDNRTDLYAFGVTLFRLLTGGYPFAEGDLAYHHRHTPAPDPRGLRDDLPEDVALLILALLAKDRAARPADAAEVARRLQAILQAAGH